MAKTSFPKDHIKILLLENIHSNAVESFNAAGYKTVELVSSALPEAELIEKIKDVHIVGIRSKTQLNAKVLAHAEKLKAIGCFCIGTNQVDLAYAAQKGIPVFNSPYSNTRSVAELVVAECVMLMRRIPERSKQAHEGRWLKDATGSYELRGKTLGIIGYGRIGSQVSVLAESFGMRVLYFDVETKLPMGNVERVNDINHIFEQSDVVSLHVPATAETQWMVGKEQFSKMKKGSYLINLSRGKVVDIDALCEALDSKHLAGAAVDVFPEEPKSNADQFESPLRGKLNVILTPHIGGSTVEAQQNIGIDAAQKLASYLDTGNTMGNHSLPELNAPKQGDRHRILHIHRNEAGVLAQVNSILGEENINILSQSLQTTSTLGYLVLDIEPNAKRSGQLEDRLEKIDATIDVRVLW